MIVTWAHSRMKMDLSESITIIGSLVTLALGASMVAAAGSDTCSGSDDVLTDGKPYASGHYMSFLAPWNKGSLVEGIDYTECLTFNRSSYPDGQRISWSWPEVPPKSKGVYNFLAVDFGNYDNTVVMSPIRPSRVRDIDKLTQQYALDISGDNQGFDVIDDLFLTSKSGDTSKKLFEIEIFLHSPGFAIKYASGATQIGTFRASGTEWSASIDRHLSSAADILVLPAKRGDILAGTLDVKAVFDYLISAKILSGEEYFNGLGLGVEVRHGDGSLSINRLSITYE